MSNGGPTGPVEAVRALAAPASRRRLLVTAAAGLGGLLELAGCGGSGKASTQNIDRHVPGAKPDVGLLNRLLDAEYHAIAAYTAATPRLSGQNALAAKRFLGQELLHADRLISLIERVGGHPRRARSSYGLGHPETTGELLRLLLGVEQLQIETYREAIPKLAPGSLKATAASMFATQAQHAAVWRLQLGAPPAPSAFVTGREAA